MARRPSPLALALVVMVALISLGGFLLSRRGIESENHQLLVTDVTEAAQLLSVDFTAFATSLGSLGTVVTLTNGQPAAFDRYAKSTVLRGSSLLLVRRVGTGFVVQAGVGRNVVPGRRLDAVLGADVAATKGQLRALLLGQSHGMETLAFIIGPPQTPPGTAIVQEDSFSAAAAHRVTNTGPFKDLDAALYAAKTPSAGALVLATSPVALGGDVVQQLVPIGGDHWLLVAGAKSPLVGELAGDTPWIVLGVGLLVALMAGCLVETSSRRERFAAGLVAHRTAELERRNEQTILINELAELLQSCHTVAEAGEVVGQGIGLLFPGTAGALYGFARSRNRLDLIIEWGTQHEATFFDPGDCWALRRGRLHLVGGGEERPRCIHVPEETDYLCLPMLAQGEILGLFHLSTGSEGARVSLTELVPLASAVSENLALAIANLQLRDKLRNQSISDSLTGLFNRGYLEESLDREVDRASRLGLELSILLVDIDGFKEFNDSFGHESGDFALRQVTQAFSSQLREADIACRYGGDEFVVLLPGRSPEEALERAEAMAASVRVQRVFPSAGGAVQFLTISIGTASYPHDGSEARHLIQAADSALFRAKAAGRDQVMAYVNRLA